jgi:hypothetical protein
MPDRAREPPRYGAYSWQRGRDEMGWNDLQRMFRRSGYRFADKNMRQFMVLEHGPLPKERDML